MFTAPPFIFSILTTPFSAYSQPMPKSVRLKNVTTDGKPDIKTSRLVRHKEVCGNSVDGVTPLGPIEEVMK
jgi:hypothetical protein